MSSSAQPRIVKLLLWDTSPSASSAPIFTLIRYLATEDTAAVLQRYWRLYRAGQHRPGHPGPSNMPGVYVSRPLAEARRRWRRRRADLPLAFCSTMDGSRLGPPSWMSSAQIASKTSTCVCTVARASPSSRPAGWLAASPSATSKSRVTPSAKKSLRTATRSASDSAEQTSVLMSSTAATSTSCSF